MVYGLSPHRHSYSIYMLNYYVYIGIDEYSNPIYYNNTLAFIHFSNNKKLGIVYAYAFLIL